MAAKSSSSSSDEPTKSADIEAISLEYYKVDNMINKLANDLSRLQAIADKKYGTEKLEILKQELEIYNKQKQAILNKMAEEERERDKLKKQIQDMGGFNFDADGNITNAEQRIKQLVNWANSKPAGDDREKTQKKVEDCEEAVQRYADLVNEEIPQMRTEWEELNNTIKDHYDSLYETVSNKEKDIAEVIKYYAEKKSQAITDQYDKMTEAINKFYDEQDKTTDLNEKKQKLLELQNKMDLYAGDTSKSGQIKLAELKKEYEEAQKDLDRTIRDNQKEADLDAIEKQKEAEEQRLKDFEDPNNLNKIIEQGLKTGMINVMGEVMNLQQANADMLKNTEVGYLSVSKQIKDWNDSLAETRSLYQDIGELASKAGVQIDKSAASDYNSNGSQDINNNFDINTPINITSQGLTEEEIAEIAEEIADEKIKELKRELNEKIVK